MEETRNKSLEDKKRDLDSLIKRIVYNAHTLGYKNSFNIATDLGKRKIVINGYIEKIGVEFYHPVNNNLELLYEAYIIQGIGTRIVRKSADITNSGILLSLLEIDKLLQHDIDLLDDAIDEIF